VATIHPDMTSSKRWIQKLFMAFSSSQTIHFFAKPFSPSQPIKAIKEEVECRDNLS
jgi:hypothetical protein